MNIHVCAKISTSTELFYLFRHICPSLCVTTGVWVPNTRKMFECKPKLKWSYPQTLYISSICSVLLQHVNGIYLVFILGSQEHFNWALLCSCVSWPDSFKNCVNERGKVFLIITFFYPCLEIEFNYIMVTVACANTGSIIETSGMVIWETSLYMKEQRVQDLWKIFKSFVLNVWNQWKTKDVTSKINLGDLW